MKNDKIDDVFFDFTMGKESNNNYVYSINYLDNSLSGAICLLQLNNKKAFNKLLGHEELIIEKMNAYVFKLQNEGYQDSPIILAYDEKIDINNILGSYEKNILLSVSKGQEIHTIKSIKSNSVKNSFDTAFSHIDKLYIIDGHHRVAAAEKIYKDHKVGTTLLCLLVPISHLKLSSFVRLVTLGFTHEIQNIFSQLEKSYNIVELLYPKKLQKPQSKNEIILQTHTKAFSLCPKINDSNENIAFTFPSRLLEIITSQADENLKNRAHEKIEYIPYNFQKNLLSNIEKNQLAFYLYPPQLKEVTPVFKKNKPLCAPHSTCFYPKPLKHVITLSEGVFNVSSHAFDNVFAEINA